MTFLKSHIFALFTALLLFVAVIFVAFSAGDLKNKVKLLDGKAQKKGGHLVNYVGGVQSEIDFLASLKSNNTITFMGSSEFSDDPYSPYFYLTDSLKLPVLGVGHAHHQCFSIFCELLAGQKYLKGAKVSILFSPGWLDGPGTNTEAFLEFVPDNFLKSILHNPDVPELYKLKIGEFVQAKSNEIDSPSPVLTHFLLNYINADVPFLGTVVRKFKSAIPSVEYRIESDKSDATKQKPLPKNYTSMRDAMRKQFVSDIKSNSIFVKDDYYTRFLSTNEKVYTQARIDKMSLEENSEFKHFLLLVDLLNRYDVDATFVLQPINPYHYQGMEHLNPLMDAVVSTLKKNNIPVLNYYAHNREEYVPGTLNDVMHFGTYAWMGINEFFVKEYGK